MADYAIPKVNTAYILYVGLIDQSNTKLLKASPTIASGDFQSSLDGAAFANLATLPTVTPAAGRSVKISLSAGEMNGDNIAVTCVDAAGAEWCDQYINLQTSARGIADLAFPATTGRSMVVDASGLVDANAVKLGPTGSGTAQTARDVGASVLLSAGTGTGQLDFTSGVVKANLAQILASALTGTAAQISAAFTKFFDKAVPTGTVNSIPDAVAGAAGGIAIVGSNMGTVSSVTGSVGSVTGAVGSVTGAVGSVTGNVGGNVVGSVGSLTANNDKTGYGLAATGLDSVVMSDIAAVPGITASIKAAINWLFCLHRNTRTQTATTEIVTKDDGTTTLGQSAKSDDGVTFSRGEYS